MVYDYSTNYNTNNRYSAYPTYGSTNNIGGAPLVNQGGSNLSQNVVKPKF